MVGLILFDDGYDQISPLADLRASFEVRTGAQQSWRRIASGLGGEPVAVFVKDANLAAIVAERWAHALVNTLPDDGDEFLLVNGRCTHAPPVESLNAETMAMDTDGAMLFARMSRARTEAFFETWQRPAGVTPAIDDSVVRVLRRPWHVVSYLKENLAHDLASVEADPRQTMSADVHTISGAMMLVKESAVLDPDVVLDLRGGPVVIDEDVRVGSHAVIEGPAYLGPGSLIAPHAHIRGNTVIGPTCKVGGEVGGSVLQGFSNKGHYGYLGDSYLGEWVNLGAGTTTSNLKNTYGEVRMQHSPELADDVAEPTGLKFLGSVIGDHVKTAIGTRLLTGTCVHTGAMIATAGFPPKSIERFAFLSDDLHPATGCYDVTKFLSVAELVMSRRGQSLTPAVRARILELHHDA